MAGARQPINLVLANGKKHLTKAEIKERLDTEVKPCTDDLTAPAYLTAKQRKTFDRLAGQLNKIKILGETDTETLARYVTAEAQYETATKELRAHDKNRPKRSDFAELTEYLVTYAKWVEGQEILAKLQDRYFKQAQTAAASLGLTISSRCKLVAPVKEEAPKVNKFARFGQAQGE